ncbi:MAG TPA: hypothetical protein V6D14_28255 [Coleofasciculaceae cyanobacterium]
MILSAIVLEDLRKRSPHTSHLLLLAGLSWLAASRGLDVKESLKLRCIKKIARLKSPATGCPSRE